MCAKYLFSCCAGLSLAAVVLLFTALLQWLNSEDFCIFVGGGCGSLSWLSAVLVIVAIVVVVVADVD